MSKSQILSAVVSGIALIALYLTGNNIKWGWLVAWGNQGVLLVYTLGTEEWGFLIQVAGFSVVYIRNFVRWHRRPTVETPRCLRCETVPVDAATAQLPIYTGPAAEARSLR